MINSIKGMIKRFICGYLSLEAEIQYRKKKNLRDGNKFHHEFQKN